MIGYMQACLYHFTGTPGYGFVRIDGVLLVKGNIPSDSDIVLTWNDEKTKKSYKVEYEIVDNFVDGKIRKCANIIKRIFED